MASRTEPSPGVAAGAANALSGGSAPPTAAPTQPGAAVSPPPQKPETPFLLGSADTPPPMDPDTLVNNMRIAINNYASMFNGNPVGTNPEITAELNGGNAKSARFIKEDSGLRINARG